MNKKTPSQTRDLKQRGKKDTTFSKLLEMIVQVFFLDRARNVGNK